MANDEQEPLTAAQLAARVAAARQQTLDAIARPVEPPIFRTADDGAVLLRDGRKIEETP